MRVRPRVSDVLAGASLRITASEAERAANPAAVAMPGDAAPRRQARQPALCPLATDPMNGSHGACRHADSQEGHSRRGRHRTMNLANTNPGWRRAAGGVVLGFVLSGAPCSAQIAADTAGLGGSFGTMQMLLEKTFLKVDVLDLEIRVDSMTAGEIQRIAAQDGDGAADAMASAMIDAREVWARLAFRRGVGVDRLIEEIRKSMRKAVENGDLDAAGFESIAASLPAWYAPLLQRGIRDGDAQYYRIRGDTLHTIFVGRDGEQFIDETATAPTNRRALLASWFTRDSDFRDGLLRSLPSAR